MYAQAYFDSALKPRFLTLSSSMEMETGWGISSNKTRGYYFFAGPSTAGIIRMRVLFEGVDYSKKVPTFENFFINMFVGTIIERFEWLCDFFFFKFENPSFF